MRFYGVILLLAAAVVVHGMDFSMHDPSVRSDAPVLRNWNGDDDDETCHQGGYVGSTFNCNRAQIEQMLDVFEAASCGDTLAQTGYDFTGMYVFVNDTTPTAFTYEIVDTASIIGKDAFVQALVAFAPWYNQVYELPHCYYPFVRIIDDANCLAYIRIKRDMREFVEFRDMIQYNDVKFFFGNNRRDGRDGRNRPYNPNHSSDTDIKLNYMIEMPNSASQLAYIFDWLLDDVDVFCSKYVDRCSSLPGADWTDHAACVAYMQDKPLTISPQNIIIPFIGDTRSCRNYFMARRIGGEYFNTPVDGPDGLASRCFTLGPADGQVGRACYNPF